MLKDRIALVTGASLGVGKGIAIALGAAGATVYVTGRSGKTGDKTPSAVPCSPLPRKSHGAADAVSPWSAITATTTRCERCSSRSRRSRGDSTSWLTTPLRFPTGSPRPVTWNKPLDFVKVLDVGLRSNYVATWLAAPMLIRNGGVVFNSSSPGAKAYVHGPAYGAAKAGVDKMSHDMAHDFKPHGVVVVSVWLGLVKTEKVMMIDVNRSKYGPMLAVAESPEFGGRIIDALYNDPNRMELTGQTFFSTSSPTVTTSKTSTAISHRQAAAFLALRPNFRR